MTTNNQIQANKQNALVSTGPITAEGKAVVAKNAIKHGIFTKDLLILTKDGKEDEGEYQELLEGIIGSLHPSGQMEYLLVEKIAVDFWRLRRVLRFETGSIQNHIASALSEYYNQTNYLGVKENKTNQELNEEIAQLKSFIKWNKRYITALKQGMVHFDQPTWIDDDLESDIEADLITVIETIKENILSEDEHTQYEEGKLGFEQLRTLFKKAGYTDADIAEILIGCLKDENKDYQKQIMKYEQEKLTNRYAEEVFIKSSSLPSDGTSEKVIKYEKAIQHSIIQNLTLLKRLQSMR